MYMLSLRSATEPHAQTQCWSLANPHYWVRVTFVLESTPFTLEGREEEGIRVGCSLNLSILQMRKKRSHPPNPWISELLITELAAEVRAQSQFSHL